MKPINQEKIISRSTLRQFAQFALSALVCYVLALSFLRFLPDSSLSLWSIVALVVGAWLVLAVHELGHLLGGQLLGFRAQLFACGPVLLVREGESYRFHWNRHLALWGGIAISTPTDTQNLYQRTLAVTIGGPLASLLFGLLSVVSSFGIQRSSAEASLLLLLLDLMSFAVALRHEA